MTYKATIGARGEELAARFLEDAGYTIKARNFRIFRDEFDIIAEDEKYIVFVEVKTRAQTESNKRFGRPCLAVNYEKKKKLLRAAEAYLRRYRPGKQPRIDVIEVYFPPIHEGNPVAPGETPALDIKHLRNAVHY